MNCARTRTVKGQEVQCKGKIRASVGVYIEGGCGCCGSSSLEITYSCDKCHKVPQVNIGLPFGQYDLEAYLNKALELAG